LAIVFVAGLHVALPARYRVQPAWVVPVALLAPLAVAGPRPGHPPPRPPAFIFPEMQNPAYVPATWVPRFIDYLFLAFWTATAVSPTDTVAVKPWAKLLMMLEAAGSIALAALVIARAINILK